MPFTLNPELAIVLQAIAEKSPPAPPPAVGDYKALRQMVDNLFGGLARPMPSDVSKKDYYASSNDGHQILCRWYTKAGASKTGAAVVYLHGGGYIGGTVNDYDAVVANYVNATGVPFLSVDYRLAPEHQYPTNVDDAHRGLLWLYEHASELDVDPARIAVMGDSGGGGLAAALALYNIEVKGPEIAKQILVYPMLDDRNIVDDPALQSMATWSASANETGWTSLLGWERGAANVVPSAAPGRLIDATGLPPLYIDTGNLDIFRDEDIEYARKFIKAGIDVELHVYPGCLHGFELFAPDIGISQRAFANRYHAIKSIIPLTQANNV
jgi:acetyl esterase/lipase